MRFSTRKSNTPSEYMYRLRFYFPTELHLLQFLIAAISFRLIRIAWRSVLRHRVNFCAGIRHGKKFFPGLGIFLRAFPYARYFSCLLTVYVVLVLLKESRLDNFEFVFVLFMCVCVMVVGLDWGFTEYRRTEGVHPQRNTHNTTQPITDFIFSIVRK